MSKTVNWMRHFELQLLDKDGKGIVLSDFKVVFDIQKTAPQSFAGFVGNFRIYNLSKNTENRIMGNEFAKIRVIAGYDGLEKTYDETDVGVVRAINPETIGQQDGANYGLIFNGDIRFTITGKDNVTDSWLLLQCIDSWEGHLEAVTITTHAAGWTWQDVFDQGMKDYAPWGITKGAIPDMPPTVFPRGKVIYKTTRELMTDVSRQCNADWWYDNNQVHMRPDGKYLHEVSEAVILNANTGLIGRPQQTMGNGVNVRCLINPNIRMGGLIRLDQASVYRASLSADEVGNSAGRLSEQDSNGNYTVNGVVNQQPASINTDGDYIVGCIDYHGDTRGNPWYMDMVCIAKGNADMMKNLGAIGIGLQ
ncbi:TPA: hypothetical protein QCI16_004456 [Enterobacter ludwigii]|nr:hypothetical protein [Enterobacter ludwigii]HDR2600234.1 hypothetical protein [Enterobacter ludwigii]